MTKPKTLDQLQAEKEQAETQLAQEQHKLERLENRKGLGGTALNKQFVAKWIATSIACHNMLRIK